MTDLDGQPVSALEKRVSETYRDLAGEVASHESNIDTVVPDAFDIGSVHEGLELPLTLWENDQKPTRTVPALLAYERLLDRNELDTVARILVGLDVLVMMLDEFIDTAHTDKRRQTRLGVNLAFSSLLSFSSIPASDRDVVVDAFRAYLAEASRIPLIEQQSKRVLDEASTREQQIELIRFIYEFRARDIAVFGVLPALISDVDGERGDRIASDLQTYRAHCLLYDDIMDIEQDRRNGIVTPVRWLLDRYSDPEEVATRIEDIYRSFEYSDGDYTDHLRDIEPGYDALADALASSIAYRSE